MPSSNIKNKKNTYLLNFSIASTGPIRLKPKGFWGTKKKKAALEKNASVPKTNDSKDILLYLFSSISSLIRFFNDDLLDFNPYKIYSYCLYYSSKDEIKNFEKL